MSAEKPEGGYTERGGGRGGLRSLLGQAMRWDQLAKTPYGILPLLLLGPLVFVRVVQGSIIGLAGPNISQDLGLDLKVIGGIISIVAFLSIAGNLVIGWLADRVPRKPLVAVGALLTAAFSLIQSRASNAATYTAPAVGVQIATDINFTPAASLLADYYPVETRGRVFAVFGTLASAGQVVGLVLVGVLVANYGWRSAVVVVTAPLFVVGIGLFFLKEPVRGYFERKAMGFSEEISRREDPPQSFGEGFRTTWAVRTLRRLFFADMVGSIGHYPLTILVSFYLADQYNLDIKGRTLFLLPTVLAGMLGGFLGGGLLDAFGRRSPSSVMRVISLFNLVSVVGIVFLALQPPLPVLLVTQCLIAFGASLTGPGLSAIYSQVIPPSVRSQGLQFNALAALPSLMFVGIFTGIQFSYGWTPTFLLAIPFIVVGGLITLSAADFFETDRRNATLASGTTEDARRLKEEGKSKLLLCRGVNVFYGGNQVLFGVDFEVEEGEIVALLGTNGAGKSTLLRAISGTQEASDGVIVVDGRDITHMPPHEIASRRVVHMPGGKGVFPGLTVEENIKLGTWMADSADVAGLVADAYKLFPILEKRKAQLAGLLSGGEQQMLALAQAFLARPRLLMIDELSLGLSPAAVGELLEKVKEIHRRGTTVIVVEQSVNVALNLARRAVFMEKGEIRFSGPTAELLRRPDILRSVYVKGTGSLSAGAPTKRVLQPGARELLEVRDISKRFGGITALDGVSLKLREGEILGLIGPNGSGKTTLFDVISGYQVPNAGSVLFDGQDITTLPPHERARRKLIRRFQDARLFPSLTVFESLLVALDQRMEVRNAAMGAIQLPPARRSERLARARADRLIDLLELGAFRDKFVKELSTGLRRIVDLAFVLATEPKVLMLDEPSSGMAQAEAESLAPLLTRVRFETGCSILIIEHDMPLISAMSDELIALVNGQLLARGTAADVLNDPRLVEAFLGGSEAAIQRSGQLV